MPLAKALVMTALLACGAFFLAVGLEVPIPGLVWHAVPVRDIIIGTVLVLGGIAVGRFWSTPQDESQLVEEWKRSRKQNGRNH